MNLRLSSLRAMSMHQGIGRLTAMTAFAFALAGAGVGSAVAAPGDAASAPEGASVSYAAGSQYTVRPGQSLNDVAIAVTQSHDKGTLARASRALFEANPNAFMSHDPSRMRVGALLTIPALDATGAPAASAPVAGSASAASSAATAAAASAPNAATVGAAVGAASGVAQVNAAAASAASAAAQAATPAVSGTASSTAEASSATPGSSAAAGVAAVAGSQAVPASGAHVWSGAIQPSASEAAEGASAAAAAAAGAQPASQPRAQVSSLQQLLALKNRVLMELQKHGIGGTPAATVPPATNGAQPAAGASSAAAVSGHGSAPVSTSTDAGISQTNLSIAAAIGAALVALLAALRLGRRKRVAAAATGGSSLAEDAAAASARAAASQDVDSTHEASDVSGEAAAGHAAASAPTDHESAGDDAAAREVAERVAAEREAEIRAAAAREAAVREAAERENAERAATERQAAERAEAERAAVEKAEAEHAAASQAAAERAEAERAEADKAAAARAAEDHDAAQRAAAEHEAGAHQPLTGLPAQDHDAFQHALQEIHPTPAPFEATQPSPDTEPLPSAYHENLDGATTAASLAAAAELGAEALPLTPLEPVDESFQQEAPPHPLQWDDEPASTQATPLAEPTNEPLAESWSHQDTPPPVIDFTRQQAEPHTTSPFGQPHGETSAFDTPVPAVSAVPPAQQDAVHVEPQPQSHQHAEPATPDGAPNFELAPITPVQPALSVPTEFPRDALDAFSSLNMPLPPRVESTDDEAVSVPGSLATPPVASPEITAQQAVAPHDPDDFPHVADEITAGTAGHAAVAGLGAAGFGALKLDFDLELPPSPAQPLPVFTRADLSRIARNKLDLAAEYIDLGDLSGARTLINEVIEANDPATRTEARALLSTLAPLS
ncbi:fimbrial protein FimV [Paraburkholderia sp. SEWSISQ10-3 4]|uniref:FimV/HubP family polar landmark protein n=1 Tax=Paraburkholderia TaxID=1822464 RepID=UPI002259989F|nr:MULTISPECIES: FimV/HubP family polar landmark protein [Paraburkholderia]MCX4137537.1 fimbrial protein FimV [Paraburkholderia aspalathi]MDN7170228.1 fimbrial protein FimV [Paraburkholderia sp. SEWSISQ10-3 4]MDQ6499867.1 fimbrial protein FimV [Paraburkholderia aspalathi]